MNNCEVNAQVDHIDYREVSDECSTGNFCQKYGRAWNYDRADRFFHQVVVF